MCKRVLSRGSERTLAGRTRGCGGLVQEEIEEGGGAEEMSDSQSGDCRKAEISPEKPMLWKKGGSRQVDGKKKKLWVNMRKVIDSFVWLKLSSPVCSFHSHTKLPHTSQTADMYVAVRSGGAHLSTGHGAEGVGRPHHRLGVHHGGRVHHPQRAHLWRLWSTERERGSEMVNHSIHSFTLNQKLIVTQIKGLSWLMLQYFHWPCHIPSCL